MHWSKRQENRSRRFSLLRFVNWLVDIFPKFSILFYTKGKTNGGHSSEKLSPFVEGIDGMQFHCEEVLPDSSSIEYG